MDKKNKIAERHNDKIEKAAQNQNWEEVNRLLDQIEENYERKMRYHNHKSLNYSEKTNHRNTEAIDYIADNSSRADFELDKKIIWEALDSLPTTEQIIVIEAIINSKSFTKIAKMVDLSDKSVKKHLQKDIQILKELLIDFEG